MESTNDFRVISCSAHDTPDEDREAQIVETNVSDKTPLLSEYSPIGADLKHVNSQINDKVQKEWKAVSVGM